ncbi:ABC transporter permease [Mesorhizobium sp. SB112]|uniref:ABC transporter permease n=1 Tax=Mesorhizobium sp. SB112 TaxID=3151853 RepID=UPI0032654182
METIPSRTVSDLFIKHGFKVLIVLLYVFLLAPMAMIVFASLTAGQIMKVPPEGLSLKWYEAFFQRQDLVDGLIISLRVAAITAVVTGILAVGAALFAHRLDGRRAALFQTGMTLPLLIPELLTAIGLLFFLYQIGLGKTFFGLQIGHALIAFPYAYVSISAAMRQVDPAMEEASGSLGATPWQTFRRVTLPLIMPGVVMGAVFAFITSFDLYTMSLLMKPIGGNTLPLALFDFLTYEFRPTAAAAATLSIILSALAVALIQRLVGLQRAF